ncbi:DeoR/GlpR family DNA-binding transcription regulator [Paenibacillus sp. NEAU-GSW1]|uniref:DeoR/GlpR family DNA-binding transcription regulator n=1 Tax=Paenibacillus sp. NEAU-GSW1 TaxID=2682486 RepID=UPI0012E15B24|nr:DeoR/GlpR family DNA-binding transcription regulator [Paenibacillus sp. NEAU-GSW1]MUT64875.1 DeoR family transcriptional regulator [Paenibacillus sp. NEAU-GSW1]
MLFEEERKQKIIDYIQSHGRALVPELAELFEVSESTVRRDLRELEEAKLLRRTHGGAVLIQPDTAEPSFVEKEDRYRVQKEAVALKAMSFIEEGDTIFLDSGTTTYCMVKHLKNFRKLTVVTNSNMAAQELKQMKHLDLILTGGTLRFETQAMVGPIADRAIDSIRVDKLFLAINGIDPEVGLTTPNLLEAETKRRMIKSAKQVLLVTDHSKFGKITFAKVAELSDVHHCIVDDAIAEQAIREMESEGINVTIVRRTEQ